MRAAAGFAELAAGVPAAACFLHLEQEGAEPLAACVGIIAAIETEFGRPLDVYEFMSAASVRQLAKILR